MVSITTLQGSLFTGLDNHIESAMKGLLKNPVLPLVKREVSDVPFLEQRRFNWRKVLLLSNYSLTVKVVISVYLKEHYA